MERSRIYTYIPPRKLTRLPKTVHFERTLHLPSFFRGELLVFPGENYILYTFTEIIYEPSFFFKFESEIEFNASAFAPGFPCLVKAVSSLDMGSMWWIAWKPQKKGPMKRGGFLFVDSKMKEGWLLQKGFFWEFLLVFSMKRHIFFSRCSFCIVGLCKKMVKIPKIH